VVFVLEKYYFIIEKKNKGVENETHHTQKA